VKPAGEIDPPKHLAESFASPCRSGLLPFVQTVRVGTEPTARAIRRGDTAMNQYLISVYQAEGDVPAPEILEPIVRDVEAVHAELKEAGAWVFAGGLFPPSTATVLRLKDSEVLTTDGPYVEGKEHLGGFTVILAADLDEALAWGRKVARAITLPVEVRPLQPGPRQ
jgi:hypothetical protein